MRRVSRTLWEELLESFFIQFLTFFSMSPLIQAAKKVMAATKKGSELAGTESRVEVNSWDCFWEGGTKDLWMESAMAAMELRRMHEAGLKLPSEMATSGRSLRILVMRAGRSETERARSPGGTASRILATSLTLHPGSEDRKDLKTCCRR